jgi:hypothetical protein
VMITKNNLFNNEEGKRVEVVEGSTLDMGTIILN